MAAYTTAAPQVGGLATLVPSLRQTSRDCGICAESQHHSPTMNIVSDSKNKPFLQSPGKDFYLFLITLLDTF